MGWDIEVTRNGFAFFYDRTAGRVFGPLFSSEKEANAFAAYLDQDARNYAPRNEKMAEKLEELDRLYSSFQEAVDVDWEEGSVNYELELDALEKMLGEAVAARGVNVKLALKDQLALVLSWLPTPETRVPPAPSAAEASPRSAQSMKLVRMRKLDWDAVHLDARAAKAEKEKFEAALKSTVAECRRLHILIERAGLDPNAVIRYHLCPNCSGVMYETETVCAICSYDAPPKEPQ